LVGISSPNPFRPTTLGLNAAHVVKLHTCCTSSPRTATPGITSAGSPATVDARVQTHLCGDGSPLIRAAVAAGVDVALAATYPGSRLLERRLKRWHKTGQFCPTCRAQRGGRAR
jgi:hypothetical protein